MKRITLRVPDHQHAALGRILALERVERGNRYSLNDLCVRLLMVQLSHSAASVPRTGAPAPLGDDTVHIIRTPPPPPVPRGLQEQRDLAIREKPSMLDTWTLRDVVEEPQPERSARPDLSGNGRAVEASVFQTDHAGSTPASRSNDSVEVTDEPNGTDTPHPAGHVPAIEPDPNDQADYDAHVAASIAEAEAEARERFENEGGPDGHVDH